MDIVVVSASKFYKQWRVFCIILFNLLLILQEKDSIANCNGDLHYNRATVSDIFLLCSNVYFLQTLHVLLLLVYAVNFLCLK